VPQVEISCGTLTDQGTTELLDSYLNRLFRASQVASWVCGGLILAVAGITFVDVLTRMFLNFSIGGADELSGFAVAVSLAWALSFCLFSRAHIRIDTGYLMLPGWAKRACDLLGTLLLILFFAVLSWFSILMLIDAYVHGSRTVSRLEVPLVYPLSLWVSGLLFFLLCSISLLGIAITRMLSGHFAGAQQLIGSKSLDEELAEEQASIPTNSTED